jgi:hypothetical protein
MQYSHYNSGFEMEFENQGLTHVFTLRGHPYQTQPGSRQAYAFVHLMSDLGEPYSKDYKATLTKQSPSTPAP